MRLAVDANILVGELLRARARGLLANPNLELHIAERAWDEAQYELRRRTAALVQHRKASAEGAEELLRDASRLVEMYVTMIPAERYRAVESVARTRVPRDPDDWPTVAVALLLDFDVWTQDGDFLGCGRATWTTETLVSEMTRL